MGPYIVLEIQTNDMFSLMMVVKILNWIDYSEDNSTTNLKNENIISNRSDGQQSYNRNQRPQSAGNSWNSEAESLLQMVTKSGLFLILHQRRLNNFEGV